jgi:hypothetical protein
MDLYVCGPTHTILLRHCPAAPCMRYRLLQCDSITYTFYVSDNVTQYSDNQNAFPYYGPMRVSSICTWYRNWSITTTSAVWTRSELLYVTLVYTTYVPVTHFSNGHVSIFWRLSAYGGLQRGRFVSVWDWSYYLTPCRPTGRPILDAALKYAFHPPSSVVTLDAYCHGVKCLDFHKSDDMLYTSCELLLWKTAREAAEESSRWWLHAVRSWDSGQI